MPAVGEREQMNLMKGSATMATSSSRQFVAPFAGLVKEAVQSISWLLAGHGWCNQYLLHISHKLCSEDTI